MVGNDQPTHGGQPEAAVTSSRKEQQPSGTAVHAAGPPNTVRNAFALTAFATVASVVFGDYAQDVSSWIVCFHSSAAKGKATCGESAQVEAIMVGTLVSTMVAVVATGIAARLGKLTNAAALLAIIGAMVGALFALLKATAKGAGFPRPELLGKPLYLYAICALLFAVPIVLTPRRDGEGEHAPAIALHLRIGTAILVGVFLGFAAQAASELIWDGWSGSGAKKFVIAPSATVIATGAWGIALLDPYLREPAWTAATGRRWLWMATFGLGAIVLSAGYGAFFYFSEGGLPRPWIVQAGLSRAETALMTASLLLPGIVALAIAVASPLRRTKLLGLMLAALGGSALAGTAALVVAQLRMQAEPQALSGPDVLPFVVAHALAAAAVVATVIVADYTDSRLRQSSSHAA